MRLFLRIRTLADASPRAMVLGVLTAGGLALILTAASWMAVNLPLQRQSEDWLRVPGAMLQMPGAIVAALVAMLLSPQGGHGIDQFAWLIMPVTWLTYFLFIAWLILRRLARAMAPK